LAGVSILVALAVLVAVASWISLNSFPVKLYVFQEELKAKMIERGVYREAGGIFSYPSSLYDIELLNVGMKIFHGEKTRLESLKVILEANESTLLSASIMVISADKWIYMNNTGVYEPATRSTILHIPDFGYQGIGTVDISLFCQVTILKPATVGKVNLKIEVTLVDYTLLAFTRYVGEFSVPLTIERSGIVKVMGS